MRFFLLLVALNAAFLLFFAAESESQDISPFPLGDNFSSLPAGLPLGVQYWEKITNWAFTYDNYYVAYFFYVEPAYNSFYQIIHYRITLEKTNKFGVKEWDFSSIQEGLQWADPRNGQIHRFKLRQKRHWKKLWLGHTAEWEEMHPADIGFQNETSLIIKIMQIQQDLSEKRGKKNSQ